MSKRGRHTSACPKSNKRLKKLEADSRITGVKLGATDNARTKYPPGHIKFQRFVNAGIKANCYTENGVITVFLYCEEEHKENIKDLLDS